MFKLFDADENTRSAILIDLYFNTLAYATKSGFNTEKSSTWLAIVKAVHEKATGELQTIGNSFEFFKLLMLQSSVHRPPYSLGIFTYAEMKDLTEYMLSTYFRHYKLYQYAFTKLVRMDVKLASPVLETAPTPFELLGVAFPDSEWAEKQAEIKAKIEEERRKAEEEAAKGIGPTQRRSSFYYGARIEHRMSTATSASGSVSETTTEGWSDKVRLCRSPHMGRAARHAAFSLAVPVSAVVSPCSLSVHLLGGFLVRLAASCVSHGDGPAHCATWRKPGRGTTPMPLQEKR